MMMEDNKDIFDQFRDGQSAWETPPPPSAWERLESRLDAPPPAPKANPWKPFILPGLGMLLLFVFLSVQLVKGWSTPETSFVFSEVQFEDDAHDVGTPFEAPEHFAEEPQMKAEEIQETPMDSSNQVVFSEEDGFFPTDQTVNAWGENQEIAYTGWDTLPLTDSFPQENLGQYLPFTNAAVFDYDTSGLLPGNMVVTNGFGNVLDTVRSLDQYVNRVSDLDGEMPGYLQMNVARNDIGFSSRGNNRRLTPDLLEHFNYLLGSWKYKGPSASSFGYEEWDRVDEFNLEGRGFLVLNGDTVITERMRIEQKGEDVYYIVALDTNQTPMRFRLRSRTPGEAVFKQSGLQSNEEIILRSAGDRVESIHTNGKQNPKKRREEIRSLERSE